MLGLVVAAALAAPAAAADIRPFEKGTFAALKAEFAERPLAVHFWSMTCLPCVAEMPQLAAFAKAHPEIELVFVSTDPIAQGERLGGRLDKAGLAGLRNYAYADPFSERLQFEVDRTWRGELPFTVLAAPGRATRSVTGPLEDGDFERAGFLPPR